MSWRRKVGATSLALAAPLVLSLFPGQAAHAQTLAVDAGDHQGFTRLVIRIGADREWELERTGRTWRLSLSPSIENFDLSGSFDLIQRARIADLSQADDALVMALACDCNVSAFRFRDTYMVIDVSDPDPTAEPSLEVEPPADPDPSREPPQDETTALAPDPDPRPALLPDTATGIPAPDATPPTPRPPTVGEIAAAALPDLARLLTPGPTLAPPASQPAAPAPEPEAPPAPPPAQTARPNIEEAAQIMAEQLARAAAAGLLEPQAGTPLDFADPLAPRTQGGSAAEAVGGAGTPPQEPLTTAPAQPVTAPALEAAPDRLPPTDPPILARNAFDIATAPMPDAAPVQPRLECIGRVHSLADSPTGTAEDGAEEPGLGALRQAVFDERDRLVKDAVVRLATYYLRRGFGAEAVYWLTRLEDPPADLLALGRMVDGLETPDFPHVADTSACSDQELVARYLGGAVKTPVADSEARRIQQGFAALPDQLQRQFGPDIARRLSAEGQVGTARNLRDMLRQSGLLPEAEMLTLDLDLGLTPPTPQLDAAMTQALRDDGAAPAATMSRSLALDRQESRHPDPDRLVAAEALLRETPPGRDADLLWREIAIGHARLGQIDAALATLTAGRDRAPEVWQSAVTGLVADRLSVEDGATLLILAYLVGEDWTETGSEAGRTRVAASRLLAEDGLAEAASRIMAGRPALNVPSRDDDATPARTASGWAASSWAEAAETFPGAQGDIARRMAARESGPDAAAPVTPGDTVDLDALAERVADSRALRDAADALLNRGTTPVAAGGNAP